MMAGGRLFFFVEEPQGFNYKTGAIIESEYPFEIYPFFLVQKNPISRFWISSAKLFTMVFINSYVFFCSFVVLEFCNQFSTLS